MKKLEETLSKWQDKLAEYEYELSVTASTEKSLS
jgi:hypothetical protein